MTTLAYQLYCSRNFPPLADLLSRVAATGFAAVEGYGALMSDPAATRAIAASGMAMPSAHMDLGFIEADPAGAIALAQQLGTTMVFAPYLNEEDRPTDAAGWAAFGARLAKAGAPLQDAGIAFGWHNHDFEFADLGGDDLPLDLIAGASPDLKLELDVGWVLRAGHDPLAWIAKYSDRIIAAHIKDIAPAGTCTDEDGWADVGHGTVDWAPILSALKAAGCAHLVLEHDNPSDDARFMTRSFDHLRGLL